MSINLRNLILFALLTTLIYSLSISSQAHTQHNNHLNTLHKLASNILNQQSIHNQNTFASVIQTNIKAVSDSVNKGIPSIISTKNIPSFSYDRTQCQSLNEDQKKQNLQSITSAQTKINQFKQSTKDQNLTADADNSLYYLSVVNKLSTTACGSLPSNLLIGPTPYQTNIISKKPWIFDGITMDNIKTDYIKRITTNNNVTNCGDATPFWTGYKCIDCSQPTPVWSMSLSKCVACPVGKTYDDATHSCIDEVVKPLQPSLKDLFNAVF